MKTIFSLPLLLFFNLVSSFPYPNPNRFTKSPSFSNSHRDQSPKKYFELANPLPSDRLTPALTVPVLHHSFANTINAPPFSTPYSPPSDCPPPWSYVVVELRAKCRGEQYDRIAALWLAGVEILRTSTAEPTQAGIVWKVRKDITRYSSLLARPHLNLTMMLENVVNGDYTGVYHVEVDLLYYKDSLTGKDELELKLPVPIENRGLIRNLEFESEILGFEGLEFDPNLGVSAEEPADLIIPISDSGKRGFWFRVESEMDMKTTEIRFPKNTRRAVLEIYVSFHGNDEFWYSNPPNSYITMNNLDTARANGGYREVFVTIDGELVGSEVPFPVIFTGGVNPLFWEPVVAIGAFNLPSYDLELTPFLGKLLAKKVHRLGIGVSDSIPYWLVNANLHLWLDPKSRSVEAKSSFYGNPVLEIGRSFQFKKLDGSFKIKSQRAIQYVGWVKWSGGNHTTTFSQDYKFTSSIKFKNNGTLKTVKQKIRADKVVVVRNDKRKVVARESLSRKYPLKLITEMKPGPRKDTYLMLTNVSHSLKEKHFHGGYSRRLHNSQKSEGWMEVTGHFVLAGNGNTNQSFSYRDKFGCYSRTIASKNGNLTRDHTSSGCLSVASS